MTARGFLFRPGSACLTCINITYHSFITTELYDVFNISTFFFQHPPSPKRPPLPPPIPPNILYFFSEKKLTFSSSHFTLPEFSIRIGVGVITPSRLHFSGATQIAENYCDGGIITNGDDPSTSLPFYLPAA